MRFAGWAARRVLQQAFHIDPTKKSCVQQYWCSNDFSPLQSEFKIYFYPIKHGSPLEHCSEGLPCFIFMLLCPVFCRCRAACRKVALLRQAACGQGLWLHSPRTAAFGGRFALHMPRHWPCGGVCALRAALSARLSARGAPLPHAPAGAVPHPFLAAFAAWPALYCAKMQGFATAIFSPDASFTSLPFSTVCSADADFNWLSLSI